MMLQSNNALLDEAPPDLYQVFILTLLLTSVLLSLCLISVVLYLGVTAVFVFLTVSPFNILHSWLLVS